MIKIIDETTNTISTIKDDTEVLLDPEGNTFFLREYELEGKTIHCVIYKEDKTTLFLYTTEKKKRTRDFYEVIKHELEENGYKKEIEWCKNIPSIENIDKNYFFSEYSWVVINSGMNNKVAEKIFKSFWNEGNIDFNAINHAQKNKALRKVYSRLDFYFNHLKQSKNKLMYLKSLPFIGDITKYHLARNLGLNVAKPDRHLIRVAKAFGYSDVQKFCRKISFLSGDKIGVVDLVFWRYATITSNYLEIIEKTLKKEAR